MSTFFDTDKWREIAVTLGRNKTRTAMTAFGIFWGTAMLALLLGGASGLRGMISRNFAGMATNMVGMFPQNRTMPFKGMTKGSSWSMTTADMRLIKATVPGIEHTSSLINMQGNISYADKSTSKQIMGVGSDYFKIQLPVLYSGRLLNEQDDAAGRKVAVIGNDLATSLFGSDDPVGKYVNAGGVYVQIVGVVGQKSQASIGGRVEESLIIPETTARRAFGLGDQVYFFIFTMEKGKKLAQLKPLIFRALRANHPLHPDDYDALGAFDVSEMFEQVNGVFLAVSILAFFVGFGTLIAGVIGVGNIMWIIVKERTHEIGIRRALGARPRDIIVQILAEGTVLTSVAGIAGICFATFILAMADKLTAAPGFDPAGFGLSFSAAITIMVVFMALGTAAGLIPALKAMRIKPIEALNDK